MSKPLAVVLWFAVLGGDDLISNEAIADVFEVKFIDSLLLMLTLVPSCSRKRTSLPEIDEGAEGTI